MFTVLIAISGAMVNSYAELHVLEHQVAHLEEKLDKSEFYTYKETTNIKDSLVIDLLKKDIELVESKIKELNKNEIR